MSGPTHERTSRRAQPRPGHQQQHRSRTHSPIHQADKFFLLVSAVLVDTCAFNAPKNVGMAIRKVRGRGSSGRASRRQNRGMRASHLSFRKGDWEGLLHHLALIGAYPPWGVGGVYPPTHLLGVWRGLPPPLFLSSPCPNGPDVQILPPSISTPGHTWTLLLCPDGVDTWTDWTPPAGFFIWTFGPFGHRLSHPFAVLGPPR